MHPYEISVLGEDFLFFSLTSESEADAALKFSKRSAILLPSLNADFRIAGYYEKGKPLCDYYSAALCAAVHLVKKRGLPLSDITFETPNGNLEILCTGDGIFTVSVDKCKLLLSNSIPLAGCMLDIKDVFSKSVFRVVRVGDVLRFDKKMLPRIASSQLPMPCSVVLYSSDGRRICVRSYADYNPAPPSSILINAAVAYSEYLDFGAGCVKSVLHLDDSSFCRVSYSCVEVSVKPTFLT